MAIQGISNMHPRGLIGQTAPLRAPAAPPAPKPTSTIGNFGHGIEGFAGFDRPGAITNTPSVKQPGFGDMLSGAIDNLHKSHATADVLAEQAATGDLKDIHDYMIASTQAQISTEFAVQVRNKALESFNDIMRMQL